MCAIISFYVKACKKINTFSRVEQICLGLILQKRKKYNSHDQFLIRRELVLLICSKVFLLSVYLIRLVVLKKSYYLVKLNFCWNSKRIWRMLCQRRTLYRLLNNVLFVQLPRINSRYLNFQLSVFILTSRKHHRIKKIQSKQHDPLVP